MYVQLCSCVKSTFTWVEVFGFGQLDGRTRLLLQLHDGLTALANYRAGCIAGNQHLQEVLALLWRKTQTKYSNRTFHAGARNQCSGRAELDMRAYEATAHVFVLSYVGSTFVF